jgi:hypothetical protein
MEAESRVLAGCNHLDSRDWSALPAPCKTAVKTSGGGSLQNCSRKKADARKLVAHGRLRVLLLTYL